MGNICNKHQINLVDSKLQKTSLKRNTLEAASLEDIAKLGNFIIRGLLGKGSFGKVFLVQSKDDKIYYAMKIIDKEKVKKNDCVENSKVERIILSELSFPFIVDLHCSFQTSSKLILVTEYVPGGDLFHLMLKLVKFTHEQIRLYVAELVLSLEYLHNNKCIYRDLKPENILIAEDGHIKLIDFGLSKLFLDPKKENRAESICGTAEYMAPEIILQEDYDNNVDWFSLGAIMYFLYKGKSGFKCKNDPMNVKVKKQKLQFDENIFNKEATDLITRLTAFYPSERLGYNGVNDIKAHSYFSQLDFKKVLNKEYKPVFIPLPVIHNESLVEESNTLLNNDEVLKDLKENMSQTKKFTYDGFTYVKERELKEV